MNNRVTAVFFLCAAVLSYVSSIINFSVSERSAGVIFLCLGSALLCLGATYYNKSRQDRKNVVNEENKENENNVNKE